MILSLIAAFALSDETARSARGMVVCDEPVAAEVGAAILRNGGNAIDAAVAVGLTLAVVEPTAGNIGGGGFMLIRMADGRQTFLDYREQAPRKASRNMYLGPDGKLLPDSSTLGPKAAGVPGTIAGFGVASKKFGKLPWKDLVEPAYQLAHQGFSISTVQAGALRGNRRTLEQFAETKSQYLRNGNPYEAGDLVQLPNLATTLRRIRDRGPDEFYRGETAKLIAKHMRTHGGLIDEQDLKEYKVKLRKPLTGTYRGRDELITAPPPSSGGIALLEMLHILEGLVGPMSTPEARTHGMVEAMKYAFADRSEFLGDPDFVKVPQERLLSAEHAREIRKEIGEMDRPSTDIRPDGARNNERKETTHFSVIDAAGDAVSNTYTLNGSFGSADSVDGAGFLLNNEMDDFAAKPGSANMFGLIQGEFNAIAPRKRPLSSMTPTIVVRDGKVSMILGSPGGPTIINTVLDVFLNRADLKMSPLEAVKAPRLHHQWMPDQLSAESLTPEVLADLRRRGHNVRTGGRQGIANCIFIDPVTGARIGVADRRYPVAAADGE